MDLMLSVKEHPEGIVFKVLVQPRSSKNMIAGVHEDALKIKLTAPPVDNAANQMCIQFLAKCLGVSKSSLEIVSGHTGRSKKILLRPKRDNSSKNIRKKLDDLIVSSLSS